MLPITISPDQATPISIPFRFFLVAPVFAILAGVVMLVYGPEALNHRWTAAILSLTHMITLGFLTMVMFGAVMQMLPVMSGSAFPAVKILGPVIHITLIAGVAFLCWGFLGVNRGAMVSAMLLLGVSVLLFVASGAVALARLLGLTPSLLAMGAALFGLVITLLIGIGNGAVLSGYLPAMKMTTWVDIHLIWGLVGWMAILLIGISYQVVPMFHVTLEYPMALRRWLIPSLVGVLLIWTLIKWGASNDQWSEQWAQGYLALALMGCLSYAAETFRLHRQRRRSVTDVTIWFWNLALSCLVAAVLVYLAGVVYPPLANWEGFPFTIGLLAFAGAGHSFVSGMLYKIFPFLSWFHLQQTQLATGNMEVRVPHMREFLPGHYPKAHFYIHLLSLLLLLWAVSFHPASLRVAALAWIISHCLLQWNMFKVVWGYRRVSRDLTA